MVDLIGVIVSMDREELELLKLNWAYETDKSLNNINSSSLRYFIARNSGGEVQLLAKVSSVLVFSGKENVPWRINFSEIYSVDEVSFQLGDPAVGIGFVNQSFEKELDAICSAKPLAICPDILPLHLSIKEAVNALHRRYGVKKRNIKITLHN